MPLSSFVVTDGEPERAAIRALLEAQFAYERARRARARAVIAVAAAGGVLWVLLATGQGPASGIVRTVALGAWLGTAVLAVVLFARERYWARRLELAYRRDDVPGYFTS